MTKLGIKSAESRVHDQACLKRSIARWCQCSKFLRIHRFTEKSTLKLDTESAGLLA
jgi:hypothetical protein